MGHELPELTEITIVFLVAVALGLLLVRFRQPPIVGYILTGLVLGPTALGFVDKTDSINLLAEMGVLVLLFLIGMELSIRAFVLVLRPAVITAGLQIVVSLAVTYVFGYFAGWSPAASILMGFALAVSSTALVIKMLEDIGELRSDMGRITIGVLIAQDIAIVPILLIAESLGAGRALDYALLIKMTLAIGGLGALIWALGRPGKIVLPFSERFADKPDLLTLAMLAFCMASAVASSLLGLSAVYGAFVAGLVVGKSTLRSEAIPATHPVQSLLMVVFFLSIGLLIDLNFIAENWPVLLAFVLTIIAMKSVFNVAILRIAGERWENAFPAGLIMSQIGEFSFVVAAVGLQAAVIDYSIYQFAITLIAVSLLISPFWLVTVRRFHEVAGHGIRSFRAALAEVYEDELAEIEKGARQLTLAGRAATRWGRASHRAVKGVLKRGNGDGGEPGPVAGGSTQGAPEIGAAGEPDREVEIRLTDGLGRIARQIGGQTRKGFSRAMSLAGAALRRRKGKEGEETDTAAQSAAPPQQPTQPPVSAPAHEPPATTPDASPQAAEGEIPAQDAGADASSTPRGTEPRRE